MSNLLPCPFCGAPAQRSDVPADIDDDNAGASYIECTKCSACTALHFDRKENLDRSWNDRAGHEDQLFDIAKRWAALDGGSWNIDRHAREKSELLADTKALIAKMENASGK